MHIKTWNPTLSYFYPQIKMEFTSEHINSLTQMLKPPDEDSDSDCELDQRVNKKELLMFLKI